VVSGALRECKAPQAAILAKSFRGWFVRLLIIRQTAY
jgi:hypothetical protein